MPKSNCLKSFFENRSNWSVKDRKGRKLQNYECEIRLLIEYAIFYWRINHSCRSASIGSSFAAFIAG